jgi:hypothetical protein
MLLSCITTRFHLASTFSYSHLVESALFNMLSFLFNSLVTSAESGNMSGGKMANSLGH